MLRTFAASAAVILLAGAATAQNNHQVELINNQFMPSDLIINEGDTVTWTWANGIHNVNTTSGAFTSGAPVATPNSFSQTFDAAFVGANPVAGGVYDYHCDLHVALGMVGSITVVDTRTLSGSATAGATGTFTVTGCNPGGNVVLAYSLIGSGPVQSNWGTASITPPYTQLPPIQANASGVASRTLPVPANAAGLTVHFHGVELLGGGAGVLTTPLTITVQ